MKTPEVLMAPLGDTEPVRQGLVHTGVVERWMLGHKDIITLPLSSVL